MADILIQAICFVAIIILGYALRRVGFFKKEDFHLLSKIVIKITLPAAIVSNFSGISMDPSLLLLSLLGFGFGLVFIFASLLANAGRDSEEKAFGVVNTAGYNIGNFSMPFAQGFLGPMGVVTTSLFDAGNAIICLGGSYSIAGMIRDKNKGFSPASIVKTLIKSVPFDCYVIMTALTLCSLTLPSPVFSFAQIIAKANAFMAMLMMGVGFELHADASQVKQIVRILGIRYGISFVLAAGVFVLLPFELSVRQALAILCFSPLASAAPAFTAELKGDFGLSSALNSLSIVISIVLITATLLVVL